MTLAEEIAELERLLKGRSPHNVRLLRSVQWRLEFFRNMIGYLEGTRCPRCGALVYERHTLDAVHAEPEG